MHSILFAITKPDDTSPKISEWSSIVTNISNSDKTNTAIQLLGKGAWLFLGVDGLRHLGIAISKAQDAQFSYRILVIEKAEDWNPTSKNS